MLKKAKALYSHKVLIGANPDPLIPNTSVGGKEKNIHDPFYYTLIVIVLTQ